MKHSQVGYLDKKIGSGPWSDILHLSRGPETIQILQNVQKLEIFLTQDLVVGTPHIIKDYPSNSKDTAVLCTHIEDDWYSSERI